MSFEEFKDHLENKHIPLIRELSGDDFPRSHKRHYPASIDDAPWDAMNIITFDDEEHAKRCMRVRSDEKKGKLLREDEESFMDLSTLRWVVVGEICETTK